MAVPTIVAVGAAVSATAGITVAVPTDRQLNDILLLTLQTCAQDVADPSGWTEATGSPQSVGSGGAVNSTRLLAFWKRSDGTETEVAPADSGDHNFGFVTVIRGAILSGSPINTGAGDTLTPADTPVIIPGSTTTVVDCLVLAMVAHGLDVSSTQFSGWTNASLSDVVEIADKSATSGRGGGIGIASGRKAVAGVYSATTAVCANVSQQARLSIAIKPEPPPIFNERRCLVSFVQFKIPEAP